jgi:hypothetical protein
MSAMDEQKAHDVLVSKLFYAHKHTLGNLKKLKDWFKAEDRVAPATLVESVHIIEHSTKTLDALMGLGGRVPYQLREEMRQSTTNRRRRG